MAIPPRQCGQPRETIKIGRAAAQDEISPPRLNHPLAESVEVVEFQGQRPLGRLGNLLFKTGQFGRGKAHGACHGLAMEKADLADASSSPPPGLAALDE